MKATLEIPDALYRRVKAKSALAGHPVREIATRLFAAWVEDTSQPERPRVDTPQKLPPWFGVASAYASKVKRHDMTAVRESIVRGKEGS